MNSPSTIERLAVAMSSKNLKLKECVSSIDYIIALGMIGIRNKAAGSIMSVHLLGNPSSYKAARAATITLTRRLSAKGKWGLQYPDMVRIADAAWKLYLLPKCPKCTGRKFELAENAPKLSAKVCHACNGTGSRVVPEKHGNHIRDVIQALASIEEAAGRAIRAKMHNR